MKPSPTWSALGGFLVAVPFGLMLTLAMATLILGGLLRGLGTVLINAANVAQGWIVRGMSTADSFLYPPEADLPAPGSNEPQ